MKPVFKEYIQGQNTIFPDSIDSYIPKNHIVRLVSEIVDKLDISPIMATYKGGGTSSYHPRMMLKVVGASPCSIHTCFQVYSIIFL